MNESLIFGAAGLLLLGIMAVLLVFGIVVLWRIFRKAGYAGWMSLIPIYNSVVLFEICGMSGAWVILSIVASIFLNVGEQIESTPVMLMGAVLMFGSLAVNVWQGYRFGRAFGKSTAFCVMSAILMFVAEIIVAFDSSTWRDLDDYELEDEAQ